MKLSETKIALDIALSAALFASANRNRRAQPFITTTRRNYYGVPGRPLYPSHETPTIPPSFPTLDGTNDSAPSTTFHALQANSLDTNTTDTFSVAPPITLLFDTGASISCTFSKHDFVTPIKPVQQTQLKGIASGLDKKGIGTVTCTIASDSGISLPITMDNVL
jgi:hypothetical protein